ncbi:RNA 3'-phosphate cyclase [archaeon]|nr:RNA 3'-phosphate cyclase [archaeon]|tara:strand:- start:441 stop:1445 length:1005 start_codon:yes stop_codon:yes gene_type:complete
MIEINGEYGSGSGTIIRLAMALSCITKKPFKIKKIRAKRCEPGLSEQHLQVVNSITELCNGKVRGNKLHSKELEFYPGKELKNKLKVKIETSGSIGLLLQAVMLPCFFSENNKTEIEIIGGGSLGKWSPNLLYTREVFLPIIEKMGFSVNLKIEKHGFYPKGGANVKIIVNKNKNVKSLKINERGKLLKIKSISLVSKKLKDKKVCERMNEYVKNNLDYENIELVNEYVDTLSVGGGILIIAYFENTIIGWDALIDKNKKSEDVSKEAVDGFLKQINSKNVFDEYLSDQILPYMAFCKEKSFFIGKINDHVETNIWLLKKFLDVKFKNGLIERN